MDRVLTSEFMRKAHKTVSRECIDYRRTSNRTAGLMRRWESKLRTSYYPYEANPTEMDLLIMTCFLFIMISTSSVKSYRVLYRIWLVNRTKPSISGIAPLHYRFSMCDQHMHRTIHTDVLDGGLINPARCSTLNSQ